MSASDKRVGCRYVCLCQTSSTCVCVHVSLKWFVQYVTLPESQFIVQHVLLDVDSEPHCCAVYQIFPLNKNYGF